MTKKVSPLFAILLALTMATVVAAQVSYANPVFTSYQIANLGNAAANIQVYYYDASGVTTTSQNRTFSNVPVGGSVTVQQSLESTLGTGTWSAVVSSDQPIAAVVNQQLGTAGSGSSIVPYSSYSGQSAGATSVTLPAVMHNWFGYYTEMYIQNVGTGDANVTISYSPTAIGACTTGKTGTDTTSVVALKQYATKMVSQVAATTIGADSVAGCTAFGGRFLGGATLTSNQPIVVVVNEQVQGKLFTYNGFTSANAGTTLLAPAYLKNFYGFYAALTIANPGGATANVTVKYTSDASFSNPVNTTVTANKTIPAGKSITLYDGPGATNDQSDLNTLFGGATNRFFGSVTITSDVPVVAVVNQESTAAAGNKGGTYNVPAATEAGTKLSVPLIQSNFYGFYTSLTIQTVDGTDAQVRITYTSDGTYSGKPNATKSYDITTAGGFLNRYEGSSASAAQSDILDDTFWQGTSSNRFIGSATIEVLTAGKKIVAFVNSEASGTSDAQYTYNAFVVTP